MENTENRYWELIAKRLSNGLSDDENSELDSWLRQSSKNMDLFELAVHDWDLVGSMPRMSADDTELAWLRQLNQVQQYETNKTKQANPKKQKTIFILKVAAGVAVLLLLGFSLFFAGNMFVGTIEISYSANATNVVLLPDNSTVTLNRNSRIKYNKNFIRERHVQLYGEAYFEVEADATSPFTIDVGDANIKVVGTSFNVNGNQPDQGVEIMVESGVVEVRSKNPGLGMLKLEKGNFGIVSSEKLFMREQTDENYISWKTKELRFQNVPLRQVFSTLKRVYDVNIRVDEDSINEISFAAPSFSKKDIEFILSVICETHHLRWNRNELTGEFVIKSVN